MLRIVDDDGNATIRAMVGDPSVEACVREWSYLGCDDRAIKMARAREFAEGWFQASKFLAAVTVV